jgi:hypothetical protein
MGFWTMIAIFSTKNGILFDKRVGTRSFTQETAVMFKIVRFPQKLESFFDSLQLTVPLSWVHLED